MHLYKRNSYIKNMKWLKTLVRVFYAHINNFFFFFQITESMKTVQESVNVKNTEAGGGWEKGRKAGVRCIDNFTLYKSNQKAHPHQKFKKNSNVWSSGQVLRNEAGLEFFSTPLLYLKTTIITSLQTFYQRENKFNIFFFLIFPFIVLTYFGLKWCLS